MKFRVLIVEDEKELWAEPMQRALEAEASRRGFSMMVDMAQDNSSAKQLISSNCYHFISFDQHIAEKIGEILNTGIGASLTRSGIVATPLSQIIVYTGMEKSVDDIKKIMGNTSITADCILFKSEYSAKRWAQFVADFLENHYFNRYYQRAAQYLPIPLAIAAAKIEQSGFFTATPPDDAARLAVSAVCDFYRAAWHLAWLIGLALQNIPPRPAAPPDSGQGQPWAAILPALADAYPASEAWRNGEFEAACRQLTALHDDFQAAMGRDNAYWAQRLQAIKPALQALNDAAACWAAAPLIQGWQAETRQPHFVQIKTQLLRGSAWPWPLQSLLIKPPLPEGNGVHACINGHVQSGFDLLPMGDYLWLNYDDRAGRQRLYAYSHDDRTHPGSWQLDLENGQLRRRSV